MPNNPEFNPLAQTAYRLAQSILGVTELCGRGVAWLLLAMVLLQVFVVLLRYGFNAGSIALQESVNYLHATAFLLGAAYTLKHDAHVRVDIVYRQLSRRNQLRINVLGFVLFLAPFCGFIIFASLDYVGQSWVIRESSADAGGLGGVYLLKTLIPLFASLLFLQGLAQTILDWLELSDDPS